MLEAAIRLSASGYAWVLFQDVMVTGVGYRDIQRFFDHVEDVGKRFVMKRCRDRQLPERGIFYDDGIAVGLVERVYQLAERRVTTDKCARLVIFVDGVSCGLRLQRRIVGSQGNGLPRFYPDVVFIIAYFDEAGLYFDDCLFVFVADVERSTEHGDGELVGVDLKRVVFIRGYPEECFACQ